MTRINDDLYVLFLRSLIYCQIGGKYLSTATNSITISKAEQKLVFKFRSVNGGQEKCFTICSITTPLFEGILYVSDYRGGDLDAYNENFLENITSRLSELNEFGLETFVDTSEYIHRTRFSEDIRLEKYHSHLQKLSASKETKHLQ